MLIRNKAGHRQLPIGKRKIERPRHCVYMPTCVREIERKGSDKKREEIEKIIKKLSKLCIYIYICIQRDRERAIERRKLEKEIYEIIYIYIVCICNKENGRLRKSHIYMYIYI